MAENLAAGAEVGTIAAYDADQAGPIFYYIQGNCNSTSATSEKIEVFFMVKNFVKVEMKSYPKIKGVFN